MEKKKIYGIKREIVFMSVALILIGVIFVLFPKTTTVRICYIISVALLVWGVIKVGTYYKTSRVNIFGSYGLVQGATLILGSIFIFAKPELPAGFIMIILGIIMIADSMLKMQYSVDLLRIKGERWWIIMVIALIMTIAGGIVLFNPFKTGTTLMTFTGVCLILDGVGDIVIIAYISKKIDKIKKAIEKQEQEANLEFVEN